MSSTRRQNPLDIFQDPNASFADHPFGTNSDFNPSILQPSTANISNPGILIQPPLDDSLYYSPLKHPSPKSSPPAHHLPQPDFFDTVHFDMPESAHVITDSVPKKPSPKINQQSMSQRAPQKALFNTYSTSRQLEKENIYAQAPTYDGGMPSSDAFPSYSSVLGKRQTSDMSRDSSVKKQRLEDDDDAPLPEPEDLPSFTDDGGKPPYSYASLIGFAILRAPNRRLTLSQIYKWISDNFSYYKDTESGWTNSIRHNLSLNKAFVKKERPKDEPGKGNYWTIEEGMERQFLRDKPVRRPNNSDPPPYFQTIHSDGYRASAAPTMGAFALPPKPTRHVDTSKFPAETEISSDATLPPSDGAAHDEDQDQLLMPPPSRGLQSSPPPADIGSSPPVARAEADDGTPPTVRFSSVTRSGARKLRDDGFRDSGFFSSIESSATRPGYGVPPMLTSDADQERPKKSGRAEEEIARIRGSSFDPSPTRNKPVFKHPSILPPSSPLHIAGSSAFPLTPGLRFKPARQAPPSVSPMTHLRRHRESVRDLVGTPVNSRLHLVEDGIYSPAFNIHEDNINENESGNGHGLLQPPSIADFQNPNILLDDDIFESFFARGSPVKSSVKRPILKRTATTAGVLEDVTNSGRANSNPRLASPIRMLPPAQTSKPKGRSPMKRLSPIDNDAAPETPKAWKDDDIWKTMNFSSDEDEENPSAVKTSMDLFKGFQSIGATVGGSQEGKENEVLQGSSTQSKPKQKGSAKRPAFGRSVTNVV